MSSEMDTVIAVIGFVAFLIGIFLWLGLPAMMIVLGLVLMFVGVRMRPAAVATPPAERKV